MKTTTKLLLSLSLLLVPQITFSHEYDDHSDDEFVMLNGSVAQVGDEHAVADDVNVDEFDNSDEITSVRSDSGSAAPRPAILRSRSSAPALLKSSSVASDDSDSDLDENKSSNVTNLDEDWDNFLNYLDNQPATFNERMKSRSKNAKAKIARFYKNHPDAVKRSAIAGGTVALAGGAAVAYTKSSVVKENVDKAASCIAEGTGKIATKVRDTYKAVKDRMAQITATTRAAVDGEIEEMDKTYFSRADAIVLAGAAGLSYGAYKAAPTVKKAATDLGAWASAKASEASSSDAVTDLKVKAQIVAHYVQEHKVAFAAPVATLATVYAGYKVYKKVTAKPAVIAEEVPATDLN